MTPYFTVIYTPHITHKRKKNGHPVNAGLDAVYFNKYLKKKKRNTERKTKEKKKKNVRESESNFKDTKYVYVNKYGTSCML